MTMRFHFCGILSCICRYFQTTTTSPDNDASTKMHSLLWPGPICQYMWLSPQQDHKAAASEAVLRTEGRHAYYCAYFFTPSTNCFFSVLLPCRDQSIYRSIRDPFKFGPLRFYFNTADQQSTTTTTKTTAANTKVGQILSKSSCC